ncbi:unnamed protein product [Spirodela intermedia]|uniref:Uncharacterized protein n=1 Tax=Spirodela intermedia TaxID=51605 RepID=A0A7I8IVJ2_SPIIN|nr:unnamed protein product [Spirodela intermedia]CAA6661603.1 unnamed protein product [Spirodela intermedia]
MKASLKFRDDRQPLVTAKIPVSVLGFPFLSGISAGDAKELRLDLATAFESGPSFRVSYRPNDSWRPFSFLVKIGVGSLGSPSAAPMTMAAEFGLFAGRSPSFTIQIKPRLGDFFIRKSSNSAAGDGNGLIIDGGSSWNKPVNGIPIAAGIGDLFSGAELMSQSVLPLRSQAAVKFRWGVRMPPETRSAFVQDLQRKDPAGGAALRRLPVLVMSKVSVEQVLPPAAPASPATKPGDLAVSVQSQLAALQARLGCCGRPWKSCVWSSVQEATAAGAETPAGHLYRRRTGGRTKAVAPRWRRRRSQQERRERGAQEGPDEGRRWRPRLSFLPITNGMVSHPPPQPTEKP